uniref:Uncharacterized protein n=1 Tax=Anguilla anguilla TaxID=7936 RepID=A0A0E9U2Q4_ANGAN
MIYLIYSDSLNNNEKINKSTVIYIFFIFFCCFLYSFSVRENHNSHVHHIRFSLYNNI